MSVSNQYRLAKRLRWAARIIGLSAAGLLSAMLIGSAVAEVLADDSEPITMVGLTLGMLAVIALAGSILSWWKGRLAGILLMLASIGLGIHIGIFAGHNHVLA